MKLRITIDQDGKVTGLLDKNASYTEEEKARSRERIERIEHKIKYDYWREQTLLDHFGVVSLSSILDQSLAKSDYYQSFLNAQQLYDRTIRQSEKEALKIIRRSTSYIYAQNIPTRDEIKDLIIIVLMQRVEWLESQLSLSKDVISNQAITLHKLTKADTLMVHTERGKVGNHTRSKHYTGAKEAVRIIFSKDVSMDRGMLRSKIRKLCRDEVDGFSYFLDTSKDVTGEKKTRYYGETFSIKTVYNKWFDQFKKDLTEN
jgi:hypothetical protein